MNKIEKLENQLKEIQSELAKLKESKFEVCKWYKSINSRFMYFAQYEYEHNTYGFCHDGEWSRELIVHHSYVDFSEYRPATDKEVEEALIKEAIKRGFKEGVYYEWKNAPYQYWCKGVSKKPLEGKFGFKGNALYLGNVKIFQGGYWAEIIEEEKVIINGYEMKVDGDIVSFGCAKFDKLWFQCLHDHVGDLSNGMYKDRKGVNHFRDWLNTNRSIKSITLDSDVEITIDELKQIVEKS